ncbi:hypothetical protein ACEWBX_22065 [Vibrio parahaemolyticus]
MKIISQEVKTKLIVTCHDTERESTEDWLTNQGYEVLSEWQHVSNEFWLEAEKSTTIKLGFVEVVSDSKIDCARKFISQNCIRENIIDDEYHLPKLLRTELSEFPECVSFDTRTIGEKVLIYVLNDGKMFKAVGLSKET